MTELHSCIDFDTGYYQAKYLQRYFDDFARELELVGYTHLTIQGYAGSIAHFGHWAHKMDLAIADWSLSSVSDFAQHRCRCLGSRRTTRVSNKYSRRVRRFIIYLARQKVITPGKITVEPAPSEFHEWLIQHRGLCIRTAKRYEHELAGLLTNGIEESQRKRSIRHRLLVAKKLRTQIRVQGIRRTGSPLLQA